MTKPLPTDILATNKILQAKNITKTTKSWLRHTDECKRIDYELIIGGTAKEIASRARCKPARVHTHIGHLVRDHKLSILKIKIIGNTKFYQLVKQDVKENNTIQDIIDKTKSFLKEEPENPDTKKQFLQDLKYYERLFEEGKSKDTIVTKYERNLKARQICINHYGPKCLVCEFDFKETYGKIGENFIHIHHLVPISSIREKYVIDPINDLNPICPNCHAMIHKKEPPYTIEEIKIMIEKPKKQ